jgi:DNA replication initiation complex subunit (GINS family)
MVNNEVTYDALWSVMQKEKQTNELQLIPKNFYTDVISLIKSLDRKDLTEEEQSTKKNTERLLYELAERRKQKILIYVAFHKQMPQPAIQEEADLYGKMVELARQSTISGSQSSASKQQPSLKSTQSIPEILLPSGRKVGPFEKGDIVEVSSEEDVNFLISNTICERA